VPPSASTREALQERHNKRKFWPSRLLLLRPTNILPHSVAPGQRSHLWPPSVFPGDRSPPYATRPSPVCDGLLIDYFRTSAGRVRSLPQPSFGCLSVRLCIPDPFRSDRPGMVLHVDRVAPLMPGSSVRRPWCVLRRWYWKVRRLTLFQWIDSYGTCLFLLFQCGQSLLAVKVCK